MPIAFGAIPLDEIWTAFVMRTRPISRNSPITIISPSGVSILGVTIGSDESASIISMATSE